MNSVPIVNLDPTLAIPEIDPVVRSEINRIQYRQGLEAEQNLAELGFMKFWIEPKRWA